MGQGNRKSALEYETVSADATAPAVPSYLFEPPASLDDAEQRVTPLVEYMMAYIKYLMETTPVPIHEYHNLVEHDQNPQKHVDMLLLEVSKRKESEPSADCPWLCGDDAAPPALRDLQGYSVTAKHFDCKLFQHVVSYRILLHNLAKQPAFVVSRGYYQGYKCIPKINRTNEFVWLKLESPTQAVASSSQSPTVNMPASSSQPLIDDK